MELGQGARQRRRKLAAAVVLRRGAGGVGLDQTPAPGEAPDKTMASSTIMWLDEANGTAEFEPVGTHPNYRRLVP